MTDDDPRTRHYGEFYRLPGMSPPTDRPLWLVVGNCQAEALRLILDAVADRPYRTVRIPAVHELEQSDLPHLDALLARTSVLISQPVREDYRDLPIGTRQLAGRLPRSASTVRWPVIRYAGLHPFSVIVRHPADRSVVPPGVPYHDLRTVLTAQAGLPADAPWDVEVSAAQFVAVADASRAELARRERRDTDVGVSDVLPRCGADAAHAVNHPGNSVLAELGRRILDLRGVDLPVSPPAATLLGSVYAPLEGRVLAALGIDAPARGDWVTDRGVLTADDVHAEQLRWYADNPDYLGLTFARHAEVVDLLGMRNPGVR